MNTNIGRETCQNLSEFQSRARKMVSPCWTSSKLVLEKEGPQLSILLDPPPLMISSFRGYETARLGSNPVQAAEAS
jgi:hypothetical protein